MFIPIWEVSMQEEFREQALLAQYISLQYPDLLYTASAGGMRTSIGTAKKMKRMGYKKGTPDMLIFEPKGNWHGLLIEMKREKGGALSESQKAFLDKAKGKHYYTAVCAGFDEAKKVIDNYMKI
jgi:hypothetical protein